MKQINSYKDLIVWEKAHELVLSIYKYSQKFPKEEKYGLTSQMRRSAVSIPSNIAEGFSRKGVKDSMKFYYYAFGSLSELEYQVLLSKELKYISAGEYNETESKITEVMKILNGWIKSQKQRLNNCLPTPNS